MLLYIYRAHVKEGRLREFQNWAATHGASVHQTTPQGWKLRGIYFPVWGFGSSLVEIHWELEKYSSFDVATKTIQDGGPFDKTVSTFYEYLDIRTQSASLLKEAGHSQTLVRSD